jgi:hypothetical protein
MSTGYAAPHLMVKMKKGDLSLNTIVVAAIVLIVLVVMIVIFASNVGKFSKGLQDCVNKGGRAVDYSSQYTGQVCNSDEAQIFTFKTDSTFDGDDKACCLKISE